MTRKERLEARQAIENAIEALCTCYGSDQVSVRSAINHALKKRGLNIKAVNRDTYERMETNIDDLMEMVTKAYNTERELEALKAKASGKRVRYYCSGEPPDPSDIGPDDVLVELPPVD